MAALTFEQIKNKVELVKHDLGNGDHALLRPLTAGEAIELQTALASSDNPVLVAKVYVASHLVGSENQLLVSSPDDLDSLPVELLADLFATLSTVKKKS